MEHPIDLNELFFALQERDSTDMVKSKQLIKQLVELRDAVNESVMFTVTDVHGMMKYANNKFMELTKYEEYMLYGRKDPIIYGNYHSIDFLQELLQTIHSNRIWQGEICSQNMEGQLIWTNTTIVPFVDQENEIYQYISIHTDITDKKLAEKEVANSLQANFQHTIEHVQNLIFVLVKVDGSYVYTLHEGKLSAFFGYQSDEAYYRQPADLYPPDVANLIVDNSRHAFAGNEAAFEMELHGRYFYTTISPQERDGKVVRVVGSTVDITELRVAQQEILNLAYMDVLTNLPNRRKLTIDFERLEPAMENGAFIFIDLNRFKIINDTLGHSAGDQVIATFSELISAHIDGKNSYMYRFGGDEFVLFLPNQSKDQALCMLKEIHDLLDEPITIDSYEFLVSFAAGLAVYPEHGRTVEELYKNADVALNKAKQEQTPHALFDAKLGKDTNYRFLIETNLYQALDRDEFVLHYQPIVNQHQEVESVEALIRWTNPGLGPISPVEFIPMAEETGFIKKLDEWVVMRACREVQALKEKTGKAFNLSINISGAHFSQDNIVDMLTRALRTCNFDAHELTIEITENTLMNNTTKAIDIITRLKALGVKIAIDDFGTGYSSLGYLHRLPIDKLKIDKSFISENMAMDLPIVSSIIHLGKDFELNVTAEGIETMDQFHSLKQIGCKSFQGYHFAKPMNQEQLCEYLLMHNNDKGA